VRKLIVEDGLVVELFDGVVLVVMMDKYRWYIVMIIGIGDVLLGLGWSNINCD